MPFTAKQRAFFHAAAARGVKDMPKLAKEADAWARLGHERAPVHEEQEPDEHVPWSSLRGTK